MADWASKANHNNPLFTIYHNPLFTIYHTLQFAKHKGMYGGGGGGGRSLPITTATNARTLSVCLSCTTEQNWRQDC